jgi:hypothetical protein
LVENYVWKRKGADFRKDKGGYPLYSGMMMLWAVQKQERRQRIFVWKWLDTRMNVELTHKNIKIYT